MAKETAAPPEKFIGAKKFRESVRQASAFSRCECEDCEAAVSPLAYLADLMEYTLKHVKNGETDIDLKFLEETFQQPFGDLPAECEEMDKKVRQVRLCVEVLRRYLGKHNLPLDTKKKGALKEEQKRYVLETYGTLLTKLGTSYEEVRLIQTGDAEERQALADRLGIELGNSTYNHLTTLLLDPGTMTEADLEQRFGLADTQRDALSDCGKRGDGKHQIRRWEFDGVEWGRNAGFEGPVYGILKTEDSKPVIELFREPSHENLIARGKGSNGALKLTEQNGSGLSGDFRIKYSKDDKDIRFDVVPWFLAWRLQHLRALWREQDWPSDPFTEGESFVALDLLPAEVEFDGQQGTRVKYDSARRGLTFQGVMPEDWLKSLLNKSDNSDYQKAIKQLYLQSQRLPIIDPDIIGPDDFRIPFAKVDTSSDDGPFDLWLKRRKQIDGRLAGIKTSHLENGMEIIILEALDKTPLAQTAEALKSVADLDDLLITLSDSDEPEQVEAALLQVQLLNLTVESFTRLMAIRKKDLLAQTHPKNPEVTPEEWREFYSILAQAEKVKWFQVWRAEELKLEEKLPGLFSSRSFWNSQRQPKEGDWPPLHLQQKPLVDPDLVKPEELPAERSGKNAVRLWQARREQLDYFAKSLQKLTADGIEKLLGGTFDGASSDDLGFTDLLAKLASANPDEIANAAKKVRTKLGMTVLDFQRLMQLKNSYDGSTQTSQQNRLSVKEWTEVIAILTISYKVRVKYAEWIEEEKPWPLVDPEVIKLDDLPEPVAGKQAIDDLWNPRKDALKGMLTALTTASHSQTGFDDMLKASFNPLSPPPINALDEQLKSAEDTDVNDATQKVTMDFGLTIEDFNRLVAIKAKCDQPDPETKPTEEEWAEVYAILVTAGKLKTLYSDLDSAWPEKEKDAGIVTQNAQGNEQVEYWRALKARLPRWRSSATTRQAWQQALRGRNRPPVIDPDLLENQGAPETRDLRKPTAFQPDFSKSWQTRKDKIDDDILEPLRSSRELPGTDPADWFNLNLDNRVGLTQDDFDALDKQYKDGADIEPRLEQLNLTFEAFSYLIRVRDLLVNKAEVLPAEWEEVYSIFVQVWKQREYSVWREEERQQGIFLTPDYFQIPEPPEFDFPPPEPRTFTPWRASWDAYRDWQDTLQSRIDQQKAAVDGLQEAVSDTEEATMPRLRDALVMATDGKGTGLEDKAKWVTDFLLIDAKMSGCHKTTRIAQAIETLQQLIFSLRSGLLENPGEVDPLHKIYKELALQDFFEEEWDWMGSYATWRAAMFVFLYPENILLPSLGKPRTQPFRALVSNLRSNRRLTPMQACEAAKAYADYFKDVCTLELEASCQCKTLIKPEDCRTSSEYGDLFFMFGRGGATNAAYWSAYNPDDGSGYAQSFWEAIPGLTNATQLVGAVPYQVSDQQSLICLLACKLEKGVQKLVVTKYDREKLKWDEETTELEVPKAEGQESGSFTAVVKQTSREDSSPQIFFRLASGAVYSRMLNRDASDWAGEWDVLMDAKRGENYKLLHAVVESSQGTVFMFVSDQKGHLKYSLWPLSSGADVSSQGNLGSGPSVCSRYAKPPGLFEGSDAGLLEVFARGSNNSLLHWQSTGGKWPTPTDRGGVLTSDPHAVAWRRNGKIRVDVFARGIDLSLIQMISSGPKNWSSWTSLGGVLNSGPTACSPGDDLLYVFARGLDDALWYKAFAKEYWTTWSTLGAAGVLTSDPDAIVGFDGKIHVFAKGADNSILEKIEVDATSGIWTDWASIGGNCTSGPAAALRMTGDNVGVIDVFARGADNQLVQASYVQKENRWRDWIDVGGTLTSDPTVFSALILGAVPIGVFKEAVYVFARGADGKLWEKPWGHYYSPLPFIGEVMDAANPDHWHTWFSRSVFHDDSNDRLNEDKNIAWLDLGGEANKGLWVGAFQWEKDGDVYAYWRDQKYKGTHAMIHRDRAPSPGDGITDDFSMERIAVHCGANPEPTSRRVAYQFGHPEIRLGRFKKNGNGVYEEDSFRAAPYLAGPFEISAELSWKELQDRRAEIKAAFKPNVNGPVSNLSYLEEAYYFVPVQLALQLQQAGQYVAALDWLRTVYDYSAAKGDRKIYAGLEMEEQIPLIDAYKRSEEWLLDPLDPHKIAATRRNAYTRFTLISLTRCFLEFAGAEYTSDTPESVPRARTLYMTALELLALPELNQHSLNCEDLIGTVTIEVQDEAMVAVAAEKEKQIKISLAQIGDVGELQIAVTKVNKILNGNGSFKNRIQKATTFAAQARENHIQQLRHPTFAAMAIGRRERYARSQMLLLADSAIAEATASVGLSEFQTLQRNSSNGHNGDAVPIDHTQQIQDLVEAGGGHAGASVNINDVYPNLEVTDFGAGSRGRGSHAAKSVYQHVPKVSFDFCIPPNPLLKSLRLRAELNLFKIRNCRNIAGMERELDPYAAPTDTFSGLPMIGAGGNLILPGLNRLPPTPYRYQALIERAKQLAQLASQIETAMLYAFEKRDAEYYSLMKARQDLRLTRAGVRLQDLRVKEAEGGVKLAELQQERAQIQADHYKELLEEPINELEIISLALMGAAAALQAEAATFNIIAAMSPTGFSNVGTPQYSPQGSTNAMASSFSSLAGAASTTASILSTLASYERRREEWDFQRTLAMQDVRIGGQQVKMAEDHVRVTGQERLIAQMQAEHAEVIVDFLANKFTNVELYDWMGDVLQQVYSSFLQHATSTALLAGNQLAFERQEVPPPFIRDDYWEAPSDTGTSDGAGKSPDRRGLTGSARLLRDIYELDQHAFATNKRKLQLTRIVSLALLDPYEFQRFRETGVMKFATPMEMFDRDFPGHHLRLIKRVRTSVIALIPPVMGIRATLSTTGTSRIVIGGDVFQKVIQNLGPQSVALSSPRDASGLFELEPQPEMLLPFENIGVETNWEFRMPKAANQFDYRTIADVLLTIEYTALDSFDYRQQVIQTLKPTLSAQRPFSFRYQFADAWYDLHNPDQTATPMTVRFNTRREDFPPNLDKLKIQNLALYFARVGGKSFEVPVSKFNFAENGTEGPVGGAAASVDGIISTLKGNAGSWMAMIGKNPAGDWELSLPNDPLTKKRFNNEEIEDILFVITFSGRTPDWPT